MLHYRKTSHSTYDIKYHIVWITKYRKKVMKGQVAIWLGLDAETKQTVQNWELGTRKIPAPIIEILRLRGKLGNGALS